MRSLNQIEDSSSQAGWMFADLFLALTVIFLATVSFIPTVPTEPRSVNSNQNNKIILNPVQDQNKVLISNGFIGEYPSKSTNLFISEINEYMKNRGLPQSTSALFLEVIGNTTEFGVANDAGNLDALKFVINLRKEIPAVLSGTNTSINLSPDVKPGTVRVKITLT